MSSNDVLKLDFTATEDNFQEDARHILRQIRPQWDADTLKFKVFTDGISNKLLGCYQSGDFENLVLVRLNGEGSDIVVSRDEEQATLRMLSGSGFIPPLYCIFNNGMAYGFRPGIPLDEKTVREPNIQRLIAEEIIHLHSVQTDNKASSYYSKKLQKWLACLPIQYEDPAKQKRYESTIPIKEVLEKELEEITQQLESLNMEIKFSHNDLLLKNIIFNEAENKVSFIDFEHGFFNYEAYDIGNHFCEYAGIDEVNYDLYPTKEEQLPWLRHYLESKAESKGEEPGKVKDKDVERLFVEANKCACAAHYFWGLWALIQSKHCTIDFDYLGYADIRLTEYFRRKKEFFPLQPPA